MYHCNYIISDILILINPKQPHTMELRQLRDENEHEGHKVWEEVASVVAGVEGCEEEE